MILQARAPRCSVRADPHLHEPHVHRGLDNRTPFRDALALLCNATWRVMGAWLPHKSQLIPFSSAVRRTRHVQTLSVGFLAAPGLRVCAVVLIDDLLESGDFRRSLRVLNELLWAITGELVYRRPR